MYSRIKSLCSALLLIAVTASCQADVLLKDTEGHSISFSSLKGKWVLINYWAGWCKTCIEEIPELNRFYHKHGDKDVALFSYNYDALPLYRQNQMIKKFHITYPSLLADPSFALGLGDIVGVPVTFIFNPKGELIDTLYGGQNVETLEQAIAKK